MAITLRAARVNAGLKQLDVAKMLGIAPDTLRKFETGEAFPDVKQIKQFETIYGLTYNDINFLCDEK